MLPEVGIFARGINGHQCQHEPTRTVLPRSRRHRWQNQPAPRFHQSRIPFQCYDFAVRSLSLILLSSLLLPLAQRSSQDPLQHLPSNIEVLTHFGERADISPDNQRVAFMAKSFGDAMVIDLKSRVIQCLTCNVPAAVFLRVMHLGTGDYILIGPDHFENTHTSRTRDNELWYLSKERGSKPIKLDQRMSEGAALSKKSLKVAFSQTAAQAPDLAPEV